MILIPFLLFTALNIVTVYFSKQKFGTAMPVTIIVSALVLFYSQLLFHTFKIGYAVILAVSLAGVVLIAIYRNKRDFRERVMSEGLLLYVIVCLFIIVIDAGRHYCEWDELSHWGYMVKEMMHLDKFYSEPASHLLVHKEYPPMAPLFEMLFCFLQGGYSESSSTMGLHFMELNLALGCFSEKVAFSGKRDKAIGSILVTLVFMLAITGLDYTGIFSTIYTDLLMALIYVYAFSLILDKDTRNTKWEAFALAVTLSGMILLKQMCIAFIMLIWLAVILFMITDTLNCRDSKHRTINAATCATMIIIPLLHNHLWSRYISSLEASFGLNTQFNLKGIDIHELIIILAGGGSDLRHQTYKHYIDALFTLKLGGGVLSLTYFSSAILSLSLLACLFFVSRRITADYYSPAEYINIGIVFICGRLGYAFTMLVLYLFCFNPQEMAALASYDRYMGAYMLSELLVIITMTINIMSDRFKGRVRYSTLAAVIITAVILLDSSKFACLYPQAFKGEPMAGDRKLAEDVMDNTTADSTLFVVDTGALNIYYLNYYLQDRNIDTRFPQNVSNIDIDDTEAWETALGYIKSDDYVLIGNISESAKAKLSDYAETGDLGYGSVLKVNTTGNSLKLEKAKS